MPSKKRPKKPPEPFWDAIVSTWFRFCITFYSEEPTFSGSAPRDLKLIVESLRHRAEKKSIQWTEESATAGLWSFL